MKKIISILLIISFLASCWSSDIVVEDINQENTKTDFYIETKNFSDFWNDYEIKKTGKISSSQDIVLSSKATWMVSWIYAKAWDEVYVWTPLLKLDDNVANYYLNYKKAELSLESSKLNYEQTKVSLDKQVKDTELNLSKIKKDYELLQKTWEENLASAKITLDNSLTSNSTSLFYSTWTISKAELDYNQLVDSNKQQIKSFETTVAKDYLNLKNLFTDIIDFSDKLLWVTDVNEEENDSFQDYIWAKNTALKKELEQDLKDLIKFKSEKFDIIVDDWFEIDRLKDILIIWDDGYSKTISFLDKLEKIFDYSIESVSFSASMISWYKAQINSYQTTLQWNYSAFLTFKSSVESFLNTYKTNEEVLRKQLDISGENAQINYNKTIISADAELSAMKISLETAKNSLETAIKNRDVNLKTLENQIDLAKNSSDIAFKEYSKLSINSPINWVISEVLVNEWQDVNNGTALFKLSSLSKNEVEIWLSDKELDFVQLWQKVLIWYWDYKIDWYISSISPIADENLKYKTIVSIVDEVSLAWNIVDVFIPINVLKNLINVSSIKIKDNWVWEINIFSSWSINKVDVNLGSFFWDMVEILSCVDLDDENCTNLNIITNDISNYDENKFNLIPKQ